MDQTSIVIEEVATPQNFVEFDYLAANPDVAEAVQLGTCWSGRLHFHEHGRWEGRRIRRAISIAEAQEAKIERLEPWIRLDLPHVRRGAKYDFLANELRTQTGAAGSATVSAPEYGGLALELIERFRDGWILDCGAGKRPIYYSNVVNYETVDYESTDVLGAAEVLPFRDASFDAVFSLCVLDQTRNPFACAAEIVRVLKPGATLICAAPFLRPMRRHPPHYYGMTGQGLCALFEGALEIDEHVVFPSIGPVHALAGMVQHWASGLNGRALEAFLSTRLGDLLSAPATLHDRRWVRELSNEKNFELACATMITAHKPT